MFKITQDIYERFETISRIYKKRTGRFEKETNKNGKYYHGNNN